jgi:multiple sugar transport system substrate-binding protein
VKNHTSLAWQESQSLLYQGRSALMLIGNFITQGFPPEVAPKMAFTPFPTITAGVADAEEAPMESIHIPAQAKNQEDARKFLAFMMRADVQTEINRLEHQIPANKESSVSDDRFLQAGQKLLNGAANLTQFLDRDTSEDLATVAMKGFQEFLVKPDRLDKILADVERARKRIYGPL